MLEGEEVLGVGEVERGSETKAHGSELEGGEFVSARG